FSRERLIPNGQARAMMTSMSRSTFASLVALLLLLLAVATSILPHPWNLTPMTAVALFAGARLARSWVAMAATIACLALGDLALGHLPYEGMAWVYGSTVAVVLLGRVLQTRRGWRAPLATALAGGLLFFVVTNFGVWVGWALYPRTLAGLLQCYAA